MAESDVSISLSNIIGLALSTGLVTALLNQGLGWFRDWRKDQTSNKKLAIYSAIRLATQLESFAVECARAIADSEEFESSNEHLGKKLVIPILENYPDDIEWKALNQKSCAEILGFRNIISLSDGGLQDFYDYSPCEDELEIETTKRRHAGFRGHLAWKHAENIRKYYDLPSFDPQQASWDIVSILKKWCVAYQKNIKIA